MASPKEPLTSANIALNWKTTDISAVRSLGPVNWDALKEYAVNTKRRLAGEHSVPTICSLSSEYNMGGLHLVRRIDFQDGTRWVVRIQLHRSQSAERLLQEIATMDVVRARSEIPVPKVYAYETDRNNVVGVTFMIMDFIPGDTAMDSFGGWVKHRGDTPEQFKAKFHAAMADIQVQMASIRFPKIGTITRCSDGTYDIGPIDGIGGPFDSASEFFETWAAEAEFPWTEELIRERTPVSVVDEAIDSINNFPSRVQDFAERFPLREGPYPLMHTDLLNSNVIIDSEHNVLSVIDWENAIVVPWEVMKFFENLTVIPPALYGEFWKDDEQSRKDNAERANYVDLVKKAEQVHQCDSSLSTVFGDLDVQNFAHAFSLYKDTGKIGFYDRVMDGLEHRMKPKE